MENDFSRRRFLQKFFYTGTAFMGGAWLLNSCGAAKAVAQQQPPAATATVPEAGTQNSPKQGKPGAQKPAEPSQAKTDAANPCDDLTGVPASEVDKRQKLAYVNKSPIPDSKCGNCNLYLPPAKDKACGGCMLFKGPVRSEGYCTYWAPIS